MAHLKQCAIDLSSETEGTDQPVAASVQATKSALKDRQERSHHQRAEANSLQGTSALCRQPALSYLRALSIAGASHSLCSIPRTRTESQRRVHRSALRHSPHQIHTTGKEREWWQEHNIDPLKVASDLWQQSRERYPAARDADLPASSKDRTNGDPTGAREQLRFQTHCSGWQHARFHR